MADLILPYSAEGELAIDQLTQIKHKGKDKLTIAAKGHKLTRRMVLQVLIQVLQCKLKHVLTGCEQFTDLFARYHISQRVSKANKVPALDNEE